MCFRKANNWKLFETTTGKPKITAQYLSPGHVAVSNPFQTMMPAREVKPAGGAHWTLSRSVTFSDKYKRFGVESSAIQSALWTRAGQYEPVGLPRTSGGAGSIPDTLVLKVVFSSRLIATLRPRTGVARRMAPRADTAGLWGRGSDRRRPPTAPVGSTRVTAHYSHGTEWDGRSPYALCLPVPFYNSRQRAGVGWDCTKACAQMACPALRQDGGSRQYAWGLHDSTSLVILQAVWFVSWYSNSSTKRIHIR